MTAPEYLRDWSYAAAGRVPMSPAEALAKAWNEGYMDALADTAQGAPMRPNPYRIADEGDYDDG